MENVRERERESTEPGATRWQSATQAFAQVAEDIAQARRAGLVEAQAERGGHLSLWGGGPTSGIGASVGRQGGFPTQDLESGWWADGGCPSENSCGG